MKSKKGEIDVSLGAILILIAIIGVGVLLLGGNVLAWFEDRVDDIRNDPNRETIYYDVTCEFELYNPIFKDVTFSDKPEKQTTCYFKKSSLFSVYSISDFWTDKGTVRMSAQNKDVWVKYRVGEGSYEDHKMKLKRLTEGPTEITLQIYNEEGDPGETRTLKLNLGEFK